MGYPSLLALRAFTTPRNRFVSVSTLFAVCGVSLGVACLSIVLSITTGFQEKFQEKILGVNAHMMVLKHTPDFYEYPEVMRIVESLPSVAGVAPFVVHPMMLTYRGGATTSVLVKGIDPEAMPHVLDLPQYIVAGDLEGLRTASAPPPLHPISSFSPPSRSPLRTLHPGDQAPAVPMERPEASPPPSTNPLLQGSLVPAGGFVSQLPDEDQIPEELDIDACVHEEQGRLPGLVLGVSLAEQLQVKVGSCVQLTSPSLNPSYTLSASPPKPFRVVALFESGFSQYDTKLVYGSLRDVQPFYDPQGGITGVEIKMVNIHQTTPLAQAIEQALGNDLYYTVDWKELNRGLFSALAMQKIGMTVVLTLILIVGTFTLVANLIMRVLDKKKEIALLSALGARQSELLRIFFYQGVLAGLVGIVGGLVLGYGGAVLLRKHAFPLDSKVYFLSHVPLVIRPTELMLTASIGLAVCLMASLLPAWHAARKLPVEGLRAE